MCRAIISRGFILLAALPAAGASAAPSTSNLVLGTHDFLLAGGASFISGHGAPTGMALRSGSPGETTGASFPKQVLAPGAILTGVSFSYRYVTGYGAAGVGHGSNLSMFVGDEPLRVGGRATIYSSPHYTDYPYGGEYSKPVAVHFSGLNIPASTKYTTRLQLGFSNNDRNLQILVPLQVNVTCTGAVAGKCFVPVPPPPPPLPPIPPQPWPPATHKPWKSIGPWNIGDDIHNGGEAGTIAPAVSSAAHPEIIYMGGNNNAASSGVLKSTDHGKHWSKVNVGLSDTRLNGLVRYWRSKSGPSHHLPAPLLTFPCSILRSGSSWSMMLVTTSSQVCNLPASPPLLHPVSPTFPLLTFSPPLLRSGRHAIRGL